MNASSATSSATAHLKKLRYDLKLKLEQSFRFQPLFILNFLNNVPCSCDDSDDRRILHVAAEIPAASLPVVSQKMLLTEKRKKPIAEQLCLSCQYRLPTNSERSSMCPYCPPLACGNVFDVVVYGFFLDLH